MSVLSPGQCQNWGQVTFVWRSEVAFRTGRLESSFSLRRLAVAPHLGFLGRTGVFGSLLSEPQQ